MSFLFVIFVSMLITVNAQRSPYAGGRPGSGYKDRFVQTSTTGNDLGNRLGETNNTGTTGTIASTERLPYDAYGDRDIVNHWNSLPIEQRPFWIVNQAHIEAQRGTPSRPAAGLNSVTRPADGTAGAAADVVNRFGQNGGNAQSIQEVVYPINITPEQQINMEIQFLQNRLDALKEQQRRQNSTQNNQQNLQTRRNL